MKKRLAWKNKEKAMDTKKVYRSSDFWKSISGADHQLDFLTHQFSGKVFYSMCSPASNCFWHAWITFPLHFGWDF